MILSYAKPFEQENLQTTCENMRKNKKHVTYFSTFSIDDMKTKKKQICFVNIKIISNSRKAIIYTQKTLRPATLLKRGSNTGAFL